jgi:hypothetical protein
MLRTRLIISMGEVYNGNNILCLFVLRTSTSDCTFVTPFKELIRHGLRLCRCECFPKEVRAGKVDSSSRRVKRGRRSNANQRQNQRLSCFCPLIHLHSPNSPHSQCVSLIFTLCNVFPQSSYSLFLNPLLLIGCVQRLGEEQIW